MFRKPTSKFVEVVEAATNENLTKEDWTKISEICTLVSVEENGAAQCLEALVPRLCHRIPKVSLYSVTVLTACVKTCGRSFQQALNNKQQFLNPLMKHVTDKKTNPEVVSRVYQFLEECVKDFAEATNLTNIVQEYQNLKVQGIVPPSLPEKPVVKSGSTKSKEELEEEEQYQLALALSLSESENKKSSKSSSSSNASSTKKTPPPPASPPVPQTPLGKVRAQYQFDASESGELSFRVGDVIEVLDRSHGGWWQGQLNGVVGIFPSNYVTSVEETMPVAENDVDVESSVDKVSQLLGLLNAVDPLKEDFSSNPKIQNLFQECMQMRSELPAVIEKYQRKRDEYVLLLNTFEQARNTYVRLYNSPPQPVQNFQQQQHQQPQFGVQQLQNGMLGQQQPQQPQYMMSQPQQQMYGATQMDQQMQFQPQQQQLNQQQLHQQPQQLQHQQLQQQQQPQQFQQQPQQFQQQPQQFQQQPQQLQQQQPQQLQQQPQQLQQQSQQLQQQPQQQQFQQQQFQPTSQPQSQMMYAPDMQQQQYSLPSQDSAPLQQQSQPMYASQDGGIQYSQSYVGSDYVEPQMVSQNYQQGPMAFQQQPQQQQQQQQHVDRRVSSEALIDLLS